MQRLEFLPATDNKSLAKRKMELSRQSSFPGFSKFRENAIGKWAQCYLSHCISPGAITISGVSTGEFPDMTNTEYSERNRANMAWLDHAFDLAAADSKIKGVAIFSQANPFERFLETATPLYAS